MKSKLFGAAALTLAMSMGLGTLAYAGDSKYFIDVNSSGYGWASDAVDYLCENNIAKGTGNNKYSPELYIERGDFVLLLNNSFDLGIFSGYMYGFSDVPDDSYYHDAIVNAKGSGVIKDNFAFYPEQPIMRGDAMNMLYRALDINGYIKDATTDLSMYSDADAVRDVNSQIAVATLTKMGIISGNGGKIHFNEYMSRAEMAMVFYKAFGYAEANPTQKPSTTEVSDKITTVANKPVKEEEVKEEKVAEVLSDTTTKGTVTIDGENVSGMERVDVQVKDASKTGVEVTRKANASITDCSVHAKNANSTGIVVTKNASADITNTNLYTSGSSAVALKGQDGSKITVKDSSFNISAKGSYAVKSSGETKIEGSEIYLSDSNGIAAEDNGELTVNGCDITANGVSNGIFVSSASSKDDGNRAYIKVKGSNICGDRKTTLFYSDKNDLRAELIGCPLEKIGYLVNSRASAVETENTIEITLNAQEVEADVIAEEYTRVIINLENGSLLKGSINQQNTAKYVEINVERGSQLELTTDSYIDVLKYGDAIDIYENGYTIYYDKDNSKNDWLFEGDYTLTNGGKLSPE